MAPPDQKLTAITDKPKTSDKELGVDLARIKTVDDSVWCEQQRPITKTFIQPYDGVRRWSMQPILSAYVFFGGKDIYYASL